MTETKLMREIQRAVQKLFPHGSRLFRNNVGLFVTQYGTKIKTGLLKGSSDLIGWTPICITQKMVGGRIAVFTACEVKMPGKKATKEQLIFLNNVKNNGGLSILATQSEDLENAYSEFLSRI